MKELFLNKSMNLITNYKHYSDDDKEKLLYGLEGIYLTVYKLLIIIILSIFLGIFKEIILFLLLFNIIRYPAFGFHANTSLQCLIMSLVFIVGLPYLLLSIDLNIYIRLGISIFCLINFILYAPADTVKRPLPNIKKRKIRKFFSILCCLLYSVLCIFLKSYIGTLFLVSIIVETILINPIIYKIFKQPYRNYLNLK